MPEMWQRFTDTHREIWRESGAAVLGLLGISKVPDDAEYLKCINPIEVEACNRLVLAG